MVKRMGGARRKTRLIFKKAVRNSGKFSLTKFFQVFKVGDKVQLMVEPAIHGGVYFRRFHARTGVVTRKQGRCYVVQIDDFGKTKDVIVHPVHLTKCT